MIKLRNENGSVTIFVLVSCLFIIAAVACTQIYMQSKQVAIEREYSQIKSNYETEIGDMDSIYDNIYNTLLEEIDKMNAEVKESEITDQGDDLGLEITVDVENIDDDYEISLDKDILQISDDTKDNELNNKEKIIKILPTNKDENITKEEVNLLVNVGNSNAKTITIPITEITDNYIDVLNEFNVIKGTITTGNQIGKKLSDASTDNTMWDIVIKADDENAKFGTGWNYINQDTTITDYEKAKFKWVVNYETKDIVYLGKDNAIEHFYNY